MDIFSVLFGVALVCIAMAMLAFASTFSDSFKQGLTAESGKGGRSDAMRLTDDLLLDESRADRMSELADKQAGLFDEQVKVFNAYRGHLNALREQASSVPSSNSEFQTENKERRIESTRRTIDEVINYG